MRLAWDPERRVHVDENGVEYVSDDNGVTWRERVAGDLDHVERYETRTPNPVIDNVVMVMKQQTEEVDQ